MMMYSSEADTIRGQFDYLYKLANTMETKEYIWNEINEFEAVYKDVKDDYTKLKDKLTTKYCKTFNDHIDSDDDLFYSMEWHINKIKKDDYVNDTIYDFDNLLWRIRERYLEAYNWWFERYGQVEGYFKEHNL